MPKRPKPPGKDPKPGKDGPGDLPEPAKGPPNGRDDPPDLPPPIEPVSSPAMPELPTEEQVRLALFRLREQHGPARRGATVARVAAYFEDVPSANVETVVQALAQAGDVKALGGEFYPSDEALAQAASA